MNLRTLKKNILESSLTYRVWSGSVNGPKLDAVRRMVDRVGKPDAAVLDIGCGPGTSAHLFADKDYLGIDYNAEYISDASKKFPKKRFEIGDATQLALNGSKYDIVLINSLLHHIDDAGCRSLLESIEPVLAKDCAVVVQEPLIPHASEPIKRFLMNQDRGDHFRSLDGWRDLFRSCGYNLLHEDLYDLKLANLFVGWHMYVACLTK